MKTLHTIFTNFAKRNWAPLRLLLVMFLTLTVTTNAWGETVTFTPENCTNWTSTQEEQTQTIDGITLHSTSAANNTELRLYSGATHTFTSTVGNITSILFTCTANGTSKYGPGKMTGDGYVAGTGNTGEWTGNSAEVTLSGGQSRCTSIVVTYTSSSGGGGSTPTQLTAPTGLTVDAITSSGATLSWDAVANASSYVVTIVDGGSLEKDYPVTGITTTVSDLESSTDYLWTVTAVGDGINYTNSEESETGDFTTSAAGGGGGEGECSWVATDINSIKSTDIVVITMTNNSGSTYAMSNDNGTGSAPAATSVTVSGSTITGDIADNLKWNISNSNGTLTIYPNETTSTWLYCTSTNNGVRVGTNENKTFTIDATSGYLKHDGTSRYLGVYNSQDWRCYTSSTTTNIANQTLKFYVYTCDGGGSASTPTLTVDKTSLAFGNVATDSNKEMTFTLTGSNLTADATLALSGTNAGLFSVTPSPVTPTDGSITNETITVTYTPDAKASHSATLTISSEGADDVTVSLSGTGVAQTADYTVNHYQQNITDDNYTLKETEKLSGEVGTSVTPDVKSYEGFTAPTTATTVTIKADGTTVVKYYYTRDSYTLTWNLDGGTITTEGTPEGAVKYGASLTAPVVVKDGFNFKGWNPSVPTTMPADNATYTAQWKATYTVTFLNHGEEVEKVTVEADNPVTLPTEELTSCDTENYPDFFGWTETPIAGVGTEEPADLITADFTPERSMTLHAVFVDQLPQAGGWQVVTSASELVAGKIYTIGSYGSPDSGVAMGEQKSNNRGTTSWTTGTPVELTLGGSTGAWTLYDPVEEGYLYAASNSDNYLKTQTTLNNNGRWAITISSNKAKIQAQGDKTRNIIRYNSSSSIFSCYASGQGDIQLLTKAIGTQPFAYITSCCETPAPTHGTYTDVAGSGSSMSVKLTWDAANVGRYHITGENLADDVYATNYTVSGLTECETYTFYVSAFPVGGCESPKLAIEVTPYIPKTVTFMDGSTTTQKTTSCGSETVTVPNASKECYTSIWTDENGNEYSNGQTITPTENMTLTAQYTIIKYEITFVDEDGTELQKSDVNCGEKPTYTGEIPTKEADAVYQYTFADWSPAIVPANDHATYTATYNKTKQIYTVEWYVNGKIANTEQVEAEDYATAPDIVEVPCGAVIAGWTDAEGGKYEHDSSTLHQGAKPSIQILSNKKFYAVFADIVE